MNYLVGIVLLVSAILGKMFIFEKMEEEKWKAMVPFYSEFILFKHVWNKKAFAAILLFCTVVSVSLAMLVVQESTSNVVEQAKILWNPQMVGFVLISVETALSVIALNRLAKRIGHGKSYTFGLIFLEPVFALLLGLEKRSFAK